jgi:hypothetical protein
MTVLPNKIPTTPRLVLVDPLALLDLFRTPWRYRLRPCLVISSYFRHNLGRQLNPPKSISIFGPGQSLLLPKLSLSP